MANKYTSATMHIFTEVYAQEISMLYRMYKLENSILAPKQFGGRVKKYRLIFLHIHYMFFPKRDKSLVLKRQYQILNHELVVNPN